MPVSLPFTSGQTRADGLRCAGGRGDDVDRSAAATFPILLARAVHGLLRGGVAVDGGHEAFVDAKAFLKEDVHDRREAVCRAARVRDDVVNRAVVLRDTERRGLVR